MKLIITILPDEHTEAVSRALTSNNLRVTQIASTGGFLRKGASTLLIGLDDEKVDLAIDLIKKNSHNLNENPESSPSSGHEGGKTTTIFVINVSQFIQI
jgi:uncharacterized protein YaaQ